MHSFTYDFYVLQKWHPQVCHLRRHCNRFWCKEIILCCEWTSMKMKTLNVCFLKFSTHFQSKLTWAHAQIFSSHAFDTNGRKHCSEHSHAGECASDTLSIPRISSKTRDKFLKGNTFSQERVLSITNTCIFSECMWLSLLLIFFIETSQRLRNSRCHGAQGLSEMPFHDAVGLNIFFQSQERSLSADGYNLNCRKTEEQMQEENHKYFSKNILFQSTAVPSKALIELFKLSCWNHWT